MGSKAYYYVVCLRFNDLLIKLSGKIICFCGIAGEITAEDGGAKLFRALYIITFLNQF